MAVTKISDLPEYLQEINKVMIGTGLHPIVTSRESAESALTVVVATNDLLGDKGVAVFPIKEGPEAGQYLVYTSVKI